ncbi:MAG TPA: NAD-dependent epimerase/dehydratase family protein [Lacipirellula sp.]
MSRCLITGASGFVGSNLARRLRGDGWDVRCLVRSTSRLDQLEPLGVEMVQGSLDDPASLQSAVGGVDVVFHLAGRTTALRASQYTVDNVEGTRRLTETCAAQSNPPTFLLVSSLAAGGTGTLKRPRRESDLERPVSAYGRSKLAAENAAAAVANNVPTSIIRPPVVFGPADRASLQLYRSMQFLPLHLSPGLRRFPVSVVHVADLCDGMIRVALRGERLGANTNGSNPSLGKYYVAADRNITYGEMGQLAAKAAGWAVATVPLPRPIFWAAGCLGEAVGRLRKRPSIINWDKVREACAAGWVCSDEKIRTQLGYKPGAKLEDRFAETVHWYREHGWL